MEKKGQICYKDLRKTTGGQKKFDTMDPYIQSVGLCYVLTSTHDSPNHVNIA